MDINVISSIVSVIGVVLTIYFGFKALRLEREKNNLSWPQLQLIADATCFKLKRDDFVPDLIIAPGLRGAILAELIVNKFNRNILAITGISFMEFTKKPMPIINGYIAFPIGKCWNIYIPSAINEFKNGKILIVDDFCLTGEFFQVLRTYLVGLGFNNDNIKVFCPVITKVTKVAGRSPEYYNVVTDDDNFYFPWGKAHTG
jgi:hypoxanthine phosphoribosyltransferase